MDSIILVLLPHVQDVDKAHLLSTCKTFWELRFQARFTEKYDYDDIQDTSYVDGFTDVYMHFNGLVPIHPCVCEVHYHVDCIYIPSTVKIVHITRLCEVVCVIPHTVEELYVSCFNEPIHIQDGDREIIVKFSVNSKLKEIIPRNCGKLSITYMDIREYMVQNNYLPYYWGGLVYSN
jgi:hypothetical protein